MPRDMLKTSKRIELPSTKAEVPKIKVFANPQIKVLRTEKQHAQSLWKPLQC